jgi:hypothetical protein
MPVLQAIAAGSVAKTSSRVLSSSKITFSSTYNSATPFVNGPANPLPGNMLHPFVPLAADDTSFYGVVPNSGAYPYGQVWRSTNAGTWSVISQIPYVSNIYPTAIVYGNGVLVSNNGRYSTDGGKTWQVSPSSVIPTPYSYINFSNGRFIAAVANTGTGTGVVTSTDGINWTFTSGSAIYGRFTVWTGVNYVNATSNNFVYGPNFSSMATPSGTIPQSGYGVTGVAANTNGVVVVTEVSTSGVYTSTNHGATFTKQTLSSISPGGLVYANGHFIILSNTSGADGRVAVSTNGTSWTIYQSQYPSGSSYQNDMTLAYSPGLGKIMGLYFAGPNYWVYSF